ncbi:hypothetical protein SAMN05444414_12114 [Roseovarius marisflavi]|uniref:IrrE N-terminal-like domain-containing protein n=1 Tax=Roseovarius marisflavi TaxID=1054996 RepID=A0A1M7BTS8_9RHOB|nr:hypothetical protein [Roseovarius marisflavi]SHL58425.1 hypothetical protein SAMN05444414_12114 [Roseovarius marisflavi]
MKRRPILTTLRATEIWTEMLWFRRELYSDDKFFKMTDVWETLCNDFEKWTMRTYRSNQLEDFKRKAGVVALDDRVTLTADEKLIANAKHGCKLSNFILAHELGHLALDHHARGAVVKNFQLFSGANGMCNVPPTLEELETNYAAVFFQCGAALEDTCWSPIQLAHRAFSDVEYVKKAQAVVRLDVFQRELRRPKPKRERVIL